MVNLNTSITSSILNFNNKYVSPCIAEPGLRMYDWGNCCKSYNTIKESFCARSYLNCLVEIPFLMKHAVCVILDHIPGIAIICSKAREVFRQSLYGVGHPALADRVIEKKMDQIKGSYNSNVAEIKIGLNYINGDKLELAMRKNDTVVDLKKAVAKSKNTHWCDFHLFIQGEQECLCDALRLDSLVAVDGVISLFPLPRENKDREALMAVFAAADSHHWRTHEGWGSDLPLEQWAGVSVDEGGRVIKLELAGVLNYCNYFYGFIPPEIGNLPALEVLKLAFMELNGSLPREIGALSELQYLNMEQNALTGSLPREIGRLSKLQILNLTYNSLTGSLPREIGRLSKLQGLSVSGNKLSGSIPSELSQLCELKEFYVFDNQIKRCNMPPEILYMDSYREAWFLTYT